MLEFRGKVAVVTGAASGIGLAMAERFVAEGMRVVLADIDESRLRGEHARLCESGGEVVSMVCDTSAEEAVEALAAFALDHFGAVHVLCNNAGIGGLGDPWTGSMELWHRVVDINVYGVVHGIRAFLPIMTEQGEGHIVNTASMGGLLAMPGAPAYNAAKHAVVAISESLYIELKTMGSEIEVSVLCPSLVRTRLMHDEPIEIDNPMATIMSRALRDGVEHDGMEPREVAEQVVDAIRHHHFWILTHPETRDLPAARMRRAALQENPPRTFG